MKKVTENAGHGDKSGVYGGYKYSFSYDDMRCVREHEGNVKKGHGGKVFALTAAALSLCCLSALAAVLAWNTAQAKKKAAVSVLGGTSLESYDDGREDTRSFSDFSVKTFSRSLAETYHMPCGVIVTYTAYSPTDEKELHEGDIIVSVDGYDTSDAEAFAEMAESSSASHSVGLEVDRDGEYIFLEGVINK